MANDPRGPVRLYNRADGVRGHYCVGREVLAHDGLNYHEFWHTNRFCSAGEVFVGEEKARAKLVEIAQRLAASAKPQSCGGYYCSEEHGHVDCGSA